MPYTFDMIEARDPSNPEMIASNALVTIFAPGDETQTPLNITTTQGWPMANPIQVNAMGYGPAFMHETLGRVAWSGGEFTGFFTAHDSIKQEAVAAAASAEASRIAAEEAARNTVAPTVEVVAEALTTEGPARDAVNTAVTAGTTNLALKPDNGARAVGKGELVVNVRDYGAKGDGVTDDTNAIKAAIEATPRGGTLYFPAGTYFIGDYSTFTNPGSSTFARYAFKVPTNISIVGTPGATLTESIDNPNRRIMFYIAGSNVTIDTLNFHNTYNMADGSRPTSIPIGAGDGFDKDLTGTIRDITIRNCTFNRPWHPVKFNFNEPGGTAMLESVHISGCVSRGEPSTTSSGGYNFNSRPAGRIKAVTMANNKCFDVTVSAGIGLYGVQDGAVTGNFCRGSQIDGAGIELENGADNVTVAGNTLVDHFNHIWVDDSTNATISGNVMRNTVPHVNNKGVRITRQGYADEPNKMTTDITVTANTLRNCYVAAEPFGNIAGSPSFGSFIISDNTVRLDGVTNNRGIVLGGGIAARVSGNRVIGAASESISISPNQNQYIVVEGNITTKAASEPSVGLVLGTANGYRPIVANNQFINGITIPQAASMIVGNVRLYSHSGSPEGAVSAPVGSLFLRDGGGPATALYVKESGTGSTGWVAK